VDVLGHTPPPRRRARTSGLLLGVAAVLSSLAAVPAGTAAPPAPASLPGPAAAPGLPGGEGELLGELPRRGLRVATFNVLGANHTEPGGNKPGWPRYEWRMHRTVRMLERLRVGVAGFQEFQKPQQAKFRRVTGDRWAMSPDGKPVNAIVWRTDRWTLRDSGSLDVPYFNGRDRPTPYVLLDPVGPRRRPVWFVNVHNPSSAKGPAEEYRTIALRREARLVRRLTERTRHPVVLLGDFNARKDAFCPLARRGLEASAGGSWSRRRGCRLPERPRIDWIFAGPGVGLRGHLESTYPRARGVSDHRLIVSVVRPPLRPR
jgi:endonuclease/exonuclease/phosphatase family metal-dependent hydrolase